MTLQALLQFDRRSILFLAVLNGAEAWGDEHGACFSPVAVPNLDFSESVIRFGIDLDYGGNMVKCVHYTISDAEGRIDLL